ncbi:MAG: hypothetical protein HRT40_13325 [Campylobacteraceae bacterium]|nr:hypothetical protein [Campylobacteraceae bacterium]
MENTNKKILKISEKIENNQKIKIAIFGLGSVGNYLLTYLLELANNNIEILILGRNKDKLIQDVNIASVAAEIRGTLFSNIIIKDVDFNDTKALKEVFENEKPDFVVNSSRAYSGIKYGGISWHKVRAYGIWSPLSISVIKNIMIAHKEAKSDAIVINTSYSDSVNAWLKSSGLNYPDFGSGNLNHLVPRIKFAIKKQLSLLNEDVIEVTIATSHFHDVVISKEGQTEGLDPLLNITVNGKIVKFDKEDIFKSCAISMPTNQTRNMMNASSNFEIINKILKALKNKNKEIFHSPGAFGNIGGFPILIDGESSKFSYYDKYFSYEEMKEHNIKSLYFDGIEKIENRTLFYTDELIKKTKKVFNVTLPKEVKFDEIPKIADLLIKEIIKPNL